MTGNLQSSSPPICKNRVPVSLLKTTIGKAFEISIRCFAVQIRNVRWDGTSLKSKHQKINFAFGLGQLIPARGLWDCSEPCRLLERGLGSGAASALCPAQ